MAGIWDLLAWLAAAEAQPPSGDRLVNCGWCGAEAVVPVDWDDMGDAWEVALRCGACGVRRDVVLDDRQASEFDQALDRGTSAIARRLRKLERERMKLDIESLSIALERDLIGADDFAFGPPAR